MEQTPSASENITSASENTNYPDKPITAMFRSFHTAYDELFNLLDAIQDATLDSLKAAMEAGRAGATELPDYPGLRLMSHDRLIWELAVCRAVDDAQIYITRLLTLIHQVKPEQLKSEEKIPVQMVLASSSREEIIEQIIEQRVGRMSFLGVKQLQDEVKKSLGLPLFQTQDDLHRFIGAVEIRNLIVHNNGIVNETILQRAPWLGYTLGEVLHLNVTTYLSQMTATYTSLAALDSRAIDKFSLPTDGMMPKVEIEKFHAASRV